MPAITFFMIYTFINCVLERIYPYRNVYLLDNMSQKSVANGVMMEQLSDWEKQSVRETGVSRHHEARFSTPSWNPSDHPLAISLCGPRMERREASFMNSFQVFFSVFLLQFSERSGNAINNSSGVTPLEQIARKCRQTCSTSCNIVR